MKYTRIISRLDIKGPNLVKGIHMEGLRVLGRPEEFAKHYYDEGIDELMYQDVVASLYQRNSLLNIIEKTANAISIPLTVGGGIRCINDIYNVLRAGADKVCLNTGAIKRPFLIDEASKIFGSSTIVIAIETLKDEDGNYFVYTDNGREFSGVSAIKWVKEVESRGAGEIFLTSIDQDGTGKGFDKEIIQSITEAVSIPVIAHGGAGKIDHITNVIEECKVDAVAVASMLHYSYLNNNIGSYEKEGNTEFLKQKKTFKFFGKETIGSIKESLIKKNISVRTFN